MSRGFFTLTLGLMLRYRRQSVLAVSLLALLGVSGCASMNRKEQGAVIGAATGAAAGGLIGRANGGTAKGAILGAVVGGTVGAVIGHQMDQQAKELAQNIPNATVEREQADSEN